MNNFYVNQSSARLELDTGIDLSGATQKKIKYIKPNKTEGEWTASNTGTVIYFDFHKNDDGKSELDQAGKWTVWSFVEFSDGRTAPGDASVMMVLKEGQLMS